MSAFTRRNVARRHNSQDAAIAEASLRETTKTTRDDEYAEGYQDDQRANRRDRRERNRLYKRDPYAD